MSTDITRQLARFACQSRIEQIPVHVRHEATRALVNWIGSPIGACRHDTTERALAAFAPFSGNPEARLLGRGGKLDIFHAAIVNCVASGVYDYDDTHLPTVIHPTGPIASSLLALCEHQPISGGAFLNAFSLGIEVQCRLANALAVTPAKCDNAWFLTGITGGVGAAAACGRVLGLTEEEMIWAIGIAAMRAAGPRETHGSMAKNLVPAWAAQEGMQAAFLAQRGFTTSEAPLEGPRGLGHLYAKAVHWPALIDGLGATWELLNNAYKPFPSGIVMHAAITGALEIAREYRPGLAEIERVDLVVHPMCLHLTGRRAPRTAVEGTFSVYHWVAVALREREIRIRQFSDACVNDAANVALRDRVQATTDAAFRVDEAHVRVTLRDGRVIEKHVDHQLGSIERPMSDSELNAKLHDLADPVLGAARVAELAGACWEIERLPDAATLVRLAVPG